MNSASRRFSQVARSIGRRRALSAKLAIGLLVGCGLSLLLPGSASANSNEITAFTAKSAQYQTYYNARTCSTCHGASTSVADLNSYGAALWNRLIFLGFSTRPTS